MKKKIEYTITIDGTEYKANNKTYREQITKEFTSIRKLSKSTPVLVCNMINKEMNFLTDTYVTKIIDPDTYNELIYLLN